MDLKTLDYETRLNLFLRKYVMVKDVNLLDRDGLLTEHGAKTIANYLLTEGIFDTPYDMKMAALKDWDLILPEELFSAKM